LHEYFNDRGPWLVVCPLSTAVHWQREFEAWTDFNAVIYHGTQEARAIIEQHEFRTFELKGRVSDREAASHQPHNLFPTPVLIN
jgi:SNF2 family DNA or RNA helicase